MMILGAGSDSTNCHRRLPQSSSASRFTASAVWRSTLKSGSDILNAKSLRPPRQEFVELRLGGPDDLLLQRLCELVD